VDGGVLENDRVPDPLSLYSLSLSLTVDRGVLENEGVPDPLSLSLSLSTLSISLYTLNLSLLSQSLSPSLLALYLSTLHSLYPLFALSRSLSLTMNGGVLENEGVPDPLVEV